MATEEHKYLADIIKGTHATLREEALKHGPEIAWQRHVSRKDVLQKYAVSMQKLATTYWMKNNLASKLGTRCRVEWVLSQCKEYFFNSGKDKYNQREVDIERKIRENIVEGNRCIDGEIKVRQKELLPESKIKLLDVGSCYNPFATEDIFDVTAIDLIGAPENKVLQCDFLNLIVGRDKIIFDNQRVIELPENSFNVIVFSLFLEYLPCPEHRCICCKKAYDLLEAGGILLIVTPDSKHVNANIRFMKSWRYVLSKLGFMRIKYEKLQHIHCVSFRKCIYKSVALRWANMQKLPENDPLYLTQDTIYIPQDFRRTISGSKEENKEDYSAEELSSMFNELPFN